MKLLNYSNQMIEKFGSDIVLIICIEELSELIKELCKIKRSELYNRFISINKLVEEISDVEILLFELKKVFKIDEKVKNQISKKIEFDCLKFNLNSKKE